ncbi:MAG: porin [Roseateles sp.]|nr:MAG: porin [Roseateles sp.]
MKTLLITTLLAGACAAATAQTSLSLGGTLDLSLRQVHNGRLGSLRSEASGANSTSKLVIRGSEDLGGGLKAGFYLDGSMLADVGSAGTSAPAGQFWDRRSTVSLSDTRLGELRLGRDWVPTHLVWSGFDPFVTLGIAGANSFRSLTGSRALGQAFGTAPESQAANPLMRVSNALEYFLPADLGGVFGSVTLTAGEGGATANGFTRGEGFRLGWSGAGWTVAAAQFTTRNAGANRRFQDQVLGLAYNAGWARLDLAQRRWIFGPDRTVNTQLGAIIPVGLHDIKLTYLHANQSGATAALNANDATLLGVGYIYNLSKRTALYLHVARLSNQGAAAFAIAGGPAVSTLSSAPNYFGGQRSTASELGLRHDF